MDHDTELLLEEAALFAPVYQANDQSDHQQGFHALIIGASRHPYLPPPGQVTGYWRDLHAVRTD
jgi:hypothetical protein